MILKARAVSCSCWAHRMHRSYASNNNEMSRGPVISWAILFGNPFYSGVNGCWTMNQGQSRI